jgi:hypothetical protein
LAPQLDHFSHYANTKVFAIAIAVAVEFSIWVS